MPVLRDFQCGNTHFLSVVRRTSSAVDPDMSVTVLRNCLRETIPAIAIAADNLAAAVTAHIAGNAALARELLLLADDPEVGSWRYSIMQPKSSYVRPVRQEPPPLSERLKARMPTASQKRALHERDGYACRYCGMPVIRREIRKKLVAAYPNAVRWGRRDALCHTALLTMWAQYDHVVPHSHGGTNELENLVVTCSACNFAKWHYTVAELGLSDPRLRNPIESEWGGLEHFR